MALGCRPARYRCDSRWNARARRQRAALGQAEEAIRSGERIATYTRSMTRATSSGVTFPYQTASG